MEVATRCNRAMLGGRKQQLARVVGRVARIEEGRLVLEASDHGEVIANIPGVTLDASLQFAEVVGKVNDDLTIDAQYICPMPNFDMDTYERALQVMQRFPDIF